MAGGTLIKITQTSHSQFRIGIVGEIKQGGFYEMTKPNNDSLEDALERYNDALFDVIRETLRTGVLPPERTVKRLEKLATDKLKQEILATHRPISEIEAAIGADQTCEKNHEEIFDWCSYCSVVSTENELRTKIRKALGISAEKGKE